METRIRLVMMFQIEPDNQLEQMGSNSNELGNLHNTTIADMITTLASFMMSSLSHILKHTGALEVVSATSPVGIGTVGSNYTSLINANDWASLITSIIIDSSKANFDEPISLGGQLEEDLCPMPAESAWAAKAGPH